MNEAMISHHGPGHLWLASLEARGMQLGLTRMQQLCQRLGDPHRGFRSVIVGGTNGKGSTVAMLTALLEAAGCRVGATISPHLVETRERVRVAGACVSAAALDDALMRVAAAAEAAPALEPTPFEALTAAAMVIFAAAALDVVVLEVGLGGRLDATNVVDPLVSVVTRIGHDHQAVLGSTLAAIAEEKVAIARTGRPLVVSQAAVTLGALRRLGLQPDVRKVGVDLRVAAVQVTPRTLRTAAVLEGPAAGEPLHVELGLAGAHQVENAAAALLAYAALRGPLREDGGPALPPLVEVAWALTDAAWPARGEIVHESPLVVLDGAHNPEGYQVLRDLLLARAPRWQVVLSQRSNRDPEDAIRTLEPLAETFWVPRMQGKTLMPAAALAEAIARITPQAAVAVGPPEACLRQAAAEASPAAGVVVCGSLHAVGEWLGSGMLRSPRWERWLG